MKKTVENLAPRQYHLALRYLYHRFRGSLDAEMLYIERLLKKKRRFLDVGANVGIYSYYFSSRVKNVDAFEPIEEITYRLKAMGKRSVKTHNIALSNEAGEFKLYIPKKNGELAPIAASLEPRSGPCEERLVRVAPLDEFGFEDVDLMKIDTEGHESKVLEGARETIAKSKPVLIVEIEQRHIEEPIDLVFERFSSFGYDGFFLQKNRLKGLDTFSFETHQGPYLSSPMDKRYINNFIFVPSGARA